MDAGAPDNPAAGDLILYELQARSANACHPSTGGEACAAAPAPRFEYAGPGCGELATLQSIRTGTLDDLLVEAEAPGRAAGITLQYVDEVVGANALLLLPVFPNAAPSGQAEACDDLGPPYEVADAFHARGTLSGECVAAGRDETSATPCFGDAALRRVVEASEARGLRVLLDVVVDRLGDGYRYYDVADTVPLRQRLEIGEDLDDLEATWEQALLEPRVEDDPERLPSESGLALFELCGGEREGQEGLLRYLLWREAFDEERAAMDCASPATLQAQLPGFVPDEVGDGAASLRYREWVFRVLDVWLARGVAGFRVHGADRLPEEAWRYVLRKARFYQARRGGPDPVFVAVAARRAEAQARLFDAVDDGWRRDVTQGRRQAPDLEALLFEARDARLGGWAFPLPHVESALEGRATQEGTGLDPARALALYAVGAASRGALLLAAGQEWGEPWSLRIGRSDYLRGRFSGEANWSGDGDALTAAYLDLHRVRRAEAALRHGRRAFLRPVEGDESQVLAVARYLDGCGGHVMTFQRLLADRVAAKFAVPPALAEALCLGPGEAWRLVDLLRGRDIWAASHPEGRTGAAIAESGIEVSLDEQTPVRWVRLERVGG